VLVHGVGGLNIDASRIESGSDYHDLTITQSGSRSLSFRMKERGFQPATGRFPANFILSHTEDCDEVCSSDCAVAELDGQSGESNSSIRKIKEGGEVVEQKSTWAITSAGGTANRVGGGFTDSGGASRFFYVAKASKKDKGANNSHPTPKNTKLMDYLIRLITPPGGTVLDPFMGSGSTGVAAVRGGWKFIGMEMEKEYYAISRSRLEEECKT